MFQCPVFISLSLFSTSPRVLSAKNWIQCINSCILYLLIDRKTIINLYLASISINKVIIYFCLWLWLFFFCASTCLHTAISRKLLHSASMLDVTVKLKKKIVANSSGKNRSVRLYGKRFQGPSARHIHRNILVSLDPGTAPGQLKLFNFLFPLSHVRSINE